MAMDNQGQKTRRFCNILVAVLTVAALTGLSPTGEISAQENATSTAHDSGQAEESTSTTEGSTWNTSLTSVDDAEDEPDSTRQNSINMLNYMTTMTQRVNENKRNQLFLDSAYDSFDNLFPNSVDRKTQAQVKSLMDTIQGYRMLSEKRERLQYIYEQNRAQALRSAMPNPLGLLSTVQSEDKIRAAASVMYMVVDSASSYQAAASQADEQFVRDGWELDDAEAQELHKSILDAQDYMLDMVRDYDIPGDYALNRKAVQDFVSWSSKGDSELERKIAWFESESSKKTYSQFGPYWLELAQDYYNYGDYGKCLEAIRRYESISTRIFRKNTEYAEVLPMAIVSARETMDDTAYVQAAAKYCELIRENTEDDDWSLRYFASQIYVDLYSIARDHTYLDEAYELVRGNVVVLVDEQRALNKSYLQDIKKVKVPSKNPFDPKAKEARSYNKALEKEREIALPPVSEALYLNCDLLFALAEERGVDDAERGKIDHILHAGGEPIFLAQALDNRFRLDVSTDEESPDSINVTFDGSSFSIPASFVTDRSTIVVTVSGSGEAVTFDDWKVDKVKRPKGSTECSEFIVTYTSASAKEHEFTAGDSITIQVIPVAETPEEHIDFGYNAIASKQFLVVDGVSFERAE